MTRELPPKFKHVIQLEFHRKLRFWERIKCLVGYNLLFRANVLCVNRAGRIEPNIWVTTTKHIKAEDLKIAEIKESLTI